MSRWPRPSSRRSARGAFGWPETVPAPRIDLTECAGHFGVGLAAWKSVCYFAESFYSLTAPLRHDPTERIAKWKRYLNGLKQLDSGRDADSLEIPGIGVRPVRLRIGREDSRVPAAAEQALPPAREDRR